MDAPEPRLLALMAGVDLGSIRVLPPRPAWHPRAACRGHPEVNFFPSRGEPNDAAKAVCAGCPVREECLAFAQEERIEHGMWGGLSTHQRQAQRAKRTGPARRRLQVCKAG